MHDSHTWRSMALEGAGYVCIKCAICTCHDSDATTKPCPKSGDVGKMEP